MNKKLEFLQIGRGIAALFVVLLHITGSGNFYLNFDFLGGIFKAGWNAVDFFFVLSGFIIFHIHSKDIGKPSALRRYFKKRLVRVYPIYWFFCIISLIFLIIGKDYISKSSLFGIFSNPSFIIKSFLLIPQRIEPFLGVAWSLCFEMFFYIMFGIGILLGRKALFIFIIFYLILLCFQSFNFFSSENSLIFSFLSSNYNLEFLLGILVAWCFELSKNYLLTRKWIVRFLLVTGILIFVGTWICSLGSQINFGKFSIYSRCFYGISSGLIILTISNLSLKSRHKITDYFLRMGNASYVLYLVHPLVLAVLFKLVVKIGIQREDIFVNYGICLIALLACLSLSSLFHKKVETVILKFLNRHIQ